MEYLDVDEIMDNTAVQFPATPTLTPHENPTLGSRRYSALRSSPRLLQTQKNYDFPAKSELVVSEDLPPPAKLSIFWSIFNLTNDVLGLGAVSLPFTIAVCTGLLKLYKGV